MLLFHCGLMISLQDDFSEGSVVPRSLCRSTSFATFGARSIPNWTFATHGLCRGLDLFRRYAAEVRVAYVAAST